MAAEVRVLRTDWREVREHLAAARPGPALQLQQMVRAAIDGALSQGTANWDSWVLAYRNLIVHRGHRLKLNQLRPVPSLFDAQGRRIVRTAHTPILVSDPDVSDIEALGMAHNTPPVLEEDARRTIDGVLRDLRLLLTAAGTALRDAWRTRRSAPASIPQPLLQQWRDVRRTRQSYFAGYHSGSVPFAPASFTMNPHFARRMRVASLHDPASALWQRP